MDIFSFDYKYYNEGYKTLAGVDEAGRGPWAGPVVAAAVILPINEKIDGINDSKKLTPLKREKLFERIYASALSVGIGIADHSLIDKVNILEATFLAMKSALNKLHVPFDLVLVDGCHAISQSAFKQIPIIGGDSLSASIAAASIIAKVTRDKIMTDISIKYPQYNFQKHKGYGTKEHHEALLQYGPCPIHRKSFAPVRKIIESNRND